MRFATESRFCPIFASPHSSPHSPLFPTAPVSLAPLGPLVTKAARYALLAGELKEPFAEQNIDEFNAMKDDLDSVTSRVAKAGGQVLRTADQADQFTQELNEKLPQAA